MIDDKVPPANGLSKKELEELVVMPHSDQERVKEPEDAQAHEEDEERSAESGRGNVENREHDRGWRNLVAFWILGLCNNYGYVVMLSAAHDILNRLDPAHETSSSTVVDANKRDCNTMSTGAILLADIIPALLTKLVAPFFPLAVHVRMVMMIVLACAGFILVGASDNQWMAIAGVVCTAFSSGIGEATFLSYMPFFSNKNVISTWSSGTGGAGIFGSFSYTLLISLGLSSATTMYVMLVVPILMCFTFWILLERPNIHSAGDETVTGSRSSTYTANDIGGPTIENDQIPLTFTNETFKQKLSFVPNLIKYMVPIGLVYFFEYVINQGLFELIYFDGTFINHQEQYRWYQVLYQVGVFISRSSINIVHIKAIWVLAVFQGINVVLFGFEAVYFFVPNIFIVLAFVLWEGLLGGGAYVNTFHRINNEIPAEKREFSMAITTVADSFGITLAGFLAIPIHNYICSLPRDMK